MKIIKKIQSLFLTLFFSLILLSQINLTYSYVTSSSFPLYIEQNKGFSLQLYDNITQYLTINATNNALNVTTNTLIMTNDEGHFIFTPLTNSTIDIIHNMNYVTIEGQNHTQEETHLGFNTDNLGMFENEQVILIFKIAPYDVSDIFFNIAMFIICVVGLIVTPPMSDIFANGDKREQMFIWVAGWLLFGMLFFVLIYAW